MSSSHSSSHSNDNLYTETVRNLVEPTESVLEKMENYSKNRSRAFSAINLLKYEIIGKLKPKMAIYGIPSKFQKIKLKNQY